MTPTSPFARLARFTVVGAIIVAPAILLWLALGFVFRQLLAIGRPAASALAAFLAPGSPAAAAILANEYLLSALTAVVVLAALCGLGFLTTRVVWQQLVRRFESLLAKLPLVHALYRAVKGLFVLTGVSAEGETRVVLVEDKSIGLVTRTLTDARSGERLAVVFVPSAPNPTAGAIRIVPERALVATGWSLEEAMTLLVTGGGVAPDEIAARPDKPTP
ncbi:MAG: DUF502 domain-containing protein [Bauldia sp.]